MKSFQSKPSKSDLKNQINWLKVKGYTNIKVTPIEMNWIEITADDPKKAEEK